MLSLLSQDADIPLEQLRAMYGYGMPQDTDEAAVADSVDTAGDYEDVAASGGAVSVDASAVAGDSEWQGENMQMTTSSLSCLNSLLFTTR